MSDDATVYFQLLGLLAESQKVPDDALVDIFSSVFHLAQQLPGSFITSATLAQLLAIKASTIVFPSTNLLKILAGMSEGTSDTKNNLLAAKDWGELAHLISLHLPPTADSLFARSTAQAKESTVNEVKADILKKCQEYGWKDSSDELLLLFQFCKVYTCRHSEITRDLRSCQPILNLIADYDPLKRWLTGIVEPHLYYTEVCEGMFDDCLNLRQFDTLKSANDQFAVLLAPLNNPGSEIISIEKWISRVLLPLTKYHECGLKPILEWLVSKSSTLSLAEVFSLWGKSVSALFSGKLTEDDIKTALRYYLAIAYYYSLVLDSKSTSMAILASYDLIRDTLGLFVASSLVEVPYPEMNGSLKGVDLSTFLKFMAAKPLVIDPTPESVQHLLNITETCISLYPINKLTISGYFQLMTSEVNSEREVTKILAGVNASNCRQLLSSLDAFVSTFMSSNQQQEVNNAVFERLLIANLFDEANSFASIKGLSANVVTDLVMAKFWDCFNSATSMNEATGGLKHAHECIKIIDSIQNDHKDIVSVKHLLKAIANLKNFKITIKGQKLVPSQVLSNFGAANSQLGSGTPMTLITLILEQNPKSYLAFGKLHKILNDLGLYFGHNLDHSFSKLNSACIESALIDNNFNYAYKRSTELFAHYSENSSDIGEYWLTFYQVGKFALPEWINDLDNISDSQLDVLVKQREVLSKAVIHCRTNSTSVGNSKLLLRQWEIVNDQIDMYYKNLQAPQTEQQEITVVDSLISEAANTTQQTSDKISKIFASGLGWALGANPP